MSEIFYAGMIPFSLGAGCIEFLEPFNNFTDHAWEEHGSAGPLIVAGRTGAAYRSPPNGWIEYEIPVGSRTKHLTIGFAWFTSYALTLGGIYMLFLYGRNTAGFLVEMNRLIYNSVAHSIQLAAGGVILETPPGQIFGGTWYYIELDIYARALIEGGDGTAEIRINGVTEATLSGPTIGTRMIGGYERIEPATQISAVSNTYDDFYLSTCNTGFLGDIHI